MRAHLLGVIAPLSLAAGLSFGQIAPPSSVVKTCATANCHTDITKQKVMHAPVEQLECMQCHDYTDPKLHLFTLAKPRNELCLSCHEIPKNDQVTHKPVADGDCLSCHDPHGSNHKSFLRKDPAKGLCLNCHTDDYSKYDFVHGPVAVGACVICHESHSSSYPKLLTNSPSKLCLECHDDKAPTGKGRWRQHKPMEDGCTSCHNPHASNEKFQLETAPPKLCLDCHEGMRETLETAPLIHGPLKDGGSCTACHNPHLSTLPKLQVMAQPDLCLKCHDKAIKTDDGRTLTDMKTLLKENPDHHGPIREGACSMCHQPHASKEPRLLIQKYPPEFYAPFAIDRYQLCFTCHVSDLVTEESGVGLTRFRDGDKNLHWLHVNREKGRTCRACHEVHASKRPAHIREEVPFGSKGWMLEINYEQNSTGGSCSPGCHKTRAYTRTVDLDSIEDSPLSTPE